MVKYRWGFFLVQVRVTDRKIYWDTIHLHCDKKGNSTKIKLTFFFYLVFSLTMTYQYLTSYASSSILPGIGVTSRMNINA